MPRTLHRGPRAIRGMTRALWRLNRLRCMTAAEIPYRMARALSARAERWGLRDGDAAPQPWLTRTEPPWIHNQVNVDAARYRAAADRIVAGKLDVFVLRDMDLGAPPPWNRDPRTGVEAPLAFGKLLDYRDPGLVGDIRYLWEPNRHMHLVTLAQAYALYGDPRYIDTIRRHLESWWSSCPFRMGPNWSSTLEVAIRLINWSATWQFLGGLRSAAFEGPKGARFRDRWLRSVHQHARFIRGHFSLYSSANNHLIGEAAGLYIATLTWPHWPETNSWRVRAAAILERETLLQNAPDGVNREQAVSYQQFELDLLLLAMLAAQVGGESFSAAFESRVAAMIEFLGSIMDTRGNLPMFGDSDDGMVVNLSREHDFCRYRSILASGALLFRRADFCSKAGKLDDKTRWLFGVGADAEFRNLQGTRACRLSKRAFPAGGYYILGSDFETSDEIRLVADAGPLGYNTIAAHGHADALSFTLSIGGQEVLVDPGTYTYHTEGPWRSYFRGTAAHNTLRLDGMDQSEAGGNFMWIRKAKTRCSLWQTSAERDILESWHDGYTRLSDPVAHGRRITFEKGAGRIVIDDMLRMSGTHDVELFFHCNEHCRVYPLRDGYAIHCGDRIVDLRLPQARGARTQIHCGSVAPISGWVSRRFGDKQPSPTIAWRARLSGDLTLRSVLTC